MKYKILTLIFLSMIMASCSSTKHTLAYFDNFDQQTDSVYAVGNYGVRIVPDDELGIYVSSLNPAATIPYNMPVSDQTVRGEQQISAVPRLQTYIVDSKGDINFPVLGRIHVKGMTTEELAEYLTSRIGEDVVDPTVRVELVNFCVDVMGEVREPGRIPVKTGRISILDALAMAGDMTEYGQRESVVLIREENGVRTVHRLNLNDVNVLSSPYFYLCQNDVIYVEPNSIRQENSKYSQNNSYKISVVSTIVSAASVIASLVIALTVK
ncbi:MAG: polysaccharide biosynthesis/export family protein [Muribaculaceae bacterium]|nr:polysaccharide biosynthesis/export family protein [Muribaculaceae bacterium]